MSAQKRLEAAMAAEDWPAAEAILRRALAESGDQAMVLRLAGFLRKRGRLAEAEVLLAPAAEAAPTAELLDLLALVQYERQSFEASERNLERLVALAPDSGLSTYQFLAKLKALRLGPEAPREVMRRARDANPGRTEFIAAYADTLSAADALAVLESHLFEVRTDPGRAAYVLLRITTLRAPLMRKARGLPTFGLSWPDTYQWPDAEALPHLKEALSAEIARGSRRGGAWLDLANIAVAEGAWDLAEAHLAELRRTSKRSPADFSAFGSAFHAGLAAMSDADILGGLVPVERLAEPPARNRESVFMASDPRYFWRFTLPFLRQLDALNISLDVHVHLLDGDAAVWRDVRAALSELTTLDASLSAEASGAAAKDPIHGRIYFHAVRYVRFFQELLRSRKPMWVLDCDVQMLRDPRPLFAMIRPYDLALRTYPCAISPLLKMTACCVGAAPTQLGLEFARRVAAYIIHFKNRGTWGWGVDQLALFSSYADMSSRGRAPRTLFLDDWSINDRTGDTGMIRFMPGIGKYAPGNGEPSSP